MTKCFWWGCRGNLKSITLGSQRVKTLCARASFHAASSSLAPNPDPIRKRACLDHAQSRKVGGTMWNKWTISKEGPAVPGCGSSPKTCPGAFQVVHILFLASGYSLFLLTSSQSSNPFLFLLWSWSKELDFRSTTDIFDLRTFGVLHGHSQLT